MTIDYEKFGPVGRHVAALIKRCEVMTPQEAELLACAWSPSLRDKDDWNDEGDTKTTRRAAEQLVQLREGARGAAWRASRAVGRDTSGGSDVVLRADDLVRRAARHGSVQTQFSAAKGAKDVIIALVARDLIDDSGLAEWGWEQYTTLAAPWRTTIGPAHPDDARTA